jgi:hypothetical protein
MPCKSLEPSISTKLTRVDHAEGYFYLFAALICASDGARLGLGRQ